MARDYDNSYEGRNYEPGFTYGYQAEIGRDNKWHQNDYNYRGYGHPSHENSRYENRLENDRNTSRYSYENQRNRPYNESEYENRSGGYRNPRESREYGRHREQTSNLNRQRPFSERYGENESYRRFYGPQEDNQGYGYNSLYGTDYGRQNREGYEDSYENNGREMNRNWSSNDRNPYEDSYNRSRFGREDNRIENTNYGNSRYYNERRGYGYRNEDRNQDLRREDRYWRRRDEDDYNLF